MTNISKEAKKTENIVLNDEENEVGEDEEEDEDEDELAEEEEEEKEKEGVMQTPAIEQAEPTVISPSSKCVPNIQVKEYEDDDDAEQARDEGQDDDESDSEEQRLIDSEVKSLRLQAVEHEQLGQFDSVEETLLKALELNPMDMRSLDAFATFLHRKRGELGRAEAFYRRAIQVCVPSLMDDLKSPRDDEEHLGESEGDAGKDSWQSILDRKRGIPGGHGNGSPLKTNHIAKVHVVTQVLLHYATFLRRAKGDIEVAGIVLRKAADISPTDAVVLGSCAHHLVEDNMSPENIRDATDMFKRALKNDPSNINNFLWYAKLLHKTGKLSEAELMFKVALTKTGGEGKMGAAATCNYAMFLYKYRNKIESADTMFQEGLEKHPRHKGLIKSYKAMLRDLKSKKLTAAARSPPPPSNNANDLSPVKEDIVAVEEEKLKEVEQDDAKSEKKKKKTKKDKKDKKEKKGKREKRQSRENITDDEGREDTSRSPPADDIDDGKSDDINTNCNDGDDIDIETDRKSDNTHLSNDEKLGKYNDSHDVKTDDDGNAIDDADEDFDDKLDSSDHNNGDNQVEEVTPSQRSPSLVDEEPVVKQLSPSVSSERAESRGSNSSRGSSREGSSRGLRARLYERVNSAGCRSSPLDSGRRHAENYDPQEDTVSKQDESYDEKQDDVESDIGDDNTEENIENSDDKLTNEELDGEDVANDEKEHDVDSSVVENSEEGASHDNLKINTSFGTDDGELSDDLNDEVTAPDSFTQDLEKRGVITPHQTVMSAVTSDEKPKREVRADNGDGDEEGESVEIAFLDVTCYDIYMFHLRQTHGDNIESDTQNRISLYWTVKVYPDTYWEHETGTQRVSDEKNSAIWRFPSDNDDSFSMRSNLHLCFLLFEATNDTLLGSAIFPGQDLVNAGMAGGDDEFEIDDEIICEDGVTVIGQLQANVKFIR